MVRSSLPEKSRPSAPNARELIALLWPRKFKGLPTRLYVPDLDGLVVSLRWLVAAVGAERHTRDDLHVSGERVQYPARLCLPYPDFAIFPKTMRATARGDQAAIGAERHADKLSAGPWQTV